MSEDQSRLEVMKKKLIAYIKQLRKDAIQDISFRGSPVTSMAEDIRIVHEGRVKLEIVKDIQRILEGE